MLSRHDLGQWLWVRGGSRSPVSVVPQGARTFSGQCDWGLGEQERRPSGGAPRENPGNKSKEELRHRVILSIKFGEKLDYDTKAAKSKMREI